ncbi:hypothetical protein DSUL_100127 [Desulfovibrionales bacterium]
MVYIYDGIYGLDLAVFDIILFIWLTDGTFLVYYLLLSYIRYGILFLVTYSGVD